MTHNGRKCRHSNFSKWRWEGNHLVGQGRQLSVIAAVTVPALAEHEIVEDIVDTTGGNRERDSLRPYTGHSRPYTQYTFRREKYYKKSWLISPSEESLNKITKKRV